MGMCIPFPCTDAELAKSPTNLGGEIQSDLELVHKIPISLSPYCIVQQYFQAFYPHCCSVGGRPGNKASSQHKKWFEQVFLCGGGPLI